MSLKGHISESINVRVAFANKGKLKGVKSKVFKLQGVKSKQPQTLDVCEFRAPYTLYDTSSCRFLLATMRYAVLT